METISIPTPPYKKAVVLGKNGKLKTHILDKLHT